MISHAAVRLELSIWVSFMARKARNHRPIDKFVAMYQMLPIQEVPCWLQMS